MVGHVVDQLTIFASLPGRAIILMTEVGSGRSRLEAFLGLPANLFHIFFLLFDHFSDTCRNQFPGHFYLDLFVTPCELSDYH